MSTVVVQRANEEGLHLHRHARTRHGAEDKSHGIRIIPPADPPELRYLDVVSCDAPDVHRRAAVEVAADALHSRGVQVPGDVETLAFPWQAEPVVPKRHTGLRALTPYETLRKNCQRESVSRGLAGHRLALGYSFLGGV